MDLVSALSGTDLDLDDQSLDTEAPPVDELAGTGFDLRGRTEAGLTLAYARDLNDADIAMLASGAQLPSVRQRIAAITHRHHLAARLVADGMPNSDVAYATGYGPSTISSLRGDPAFCELVAYYAGQKEQVYLDVHQRLGSLGMSAVDKLQQRVDHLDTVGDDPIVDARHEVARKIMPTPQLLDVAELALDRSIAPAKVLANARPAGDPAQGLIVNLNFDHPKPNGPMVDVSPTKPEPGA